MMVAECFKSSGRKLSYPLWPALLTRNNGNPKLYRSLGWLYSGYIFTYARGSHSNGGVVAFIYLFIFFKFL